MFNDNLKCRTESELIQSLYEIVGELEQRNPGRRFTPDGHLIGSIGETIAARQYGLTLYPASAETHDARSPCGKEVQIKVTQIGRIALSSEPEHLLVLHLSPDGRVSEIFNGPGALAWNVAGKIQKNGQRPVSTRKLKKLAENVAVADRIRLLKPDRLSTVEDNPEQVDLRPVLNKPQGSNMYCDRCLYRLMTDRNERVADLK